MPALTVVPLSPGPVPGTHEELTECCGKEGTERKEGKGSRKTRSLSKNLAGRPLKDNCLDAVGRSSNKSTWLSLQRAQDLAPSLLPPIPATTTTTSC